jgi:large subunit ribosomal protein L10
MLRSDKERIVAELTERLRTSPTLIIADYRGLSMPQIETLRSSLLEHGARFTVVKNTLTRRAAEAAGADALLTLLDGPTAIAFLEADGDPVAVAKALRQAARETRVLEVRGGVLEGRAITPDEIERLAQLPPEDVLRGQFVGVLTAPLLTVVGLFNAPLRDLVGAIDARIRQLEEQGDGAAAEPEQAVAAEDEPAAAAEPEQAPASEEEPATAAGAAETEATQETQETEDTTEES